MAASLNYGFEHAFTEAERKQLALLYLFKGFVQFATLGHMGRPEEEWCLPELKGVSRETRIALLDRAADVGLLTPTGERTFYNIHPALPWFFRRLFEQYYSQTRSAAVRAFVRAMGILGGHYTVRYESGKDVISAVKAEEANLLHARRNVALMLDGQGRSNEARHWALSALRDFQASENADKQVVTTLKLLEQIELGLQAPSPPL